MDTGKVNSLTLVDCFDIGGKVTAADATSDGTKLAVLTYKAIWIFEIPPNTDHYFDGKISWLPIQIGQCEAICFDGDRLIISSDEGKGDLYEIALDKLIKIRD